MYDYNVSCSYIYISSPEQILDLDVKVNVTHPCTFDMFMWLWGPNGNFVTLVRQAGGWGSGFIDTVFDDEAPISIYTGSDPFTGSYRPETPLSTAFDGAALTGWWHLDVYAWGGGGTLNSWSLIVTTADQDAPVVSLDTPVPDVISPPDNRTATVTLSGNVTDADSGVEQAWLEVDDEYGELDGACPVTLDPDGNFTQGLDLTATCHTTDTNGRTYDICLHALDQVRNEAVSTHVTVTVPPDLDPPTLTLNTPDPSELSPPDGRTVLVDVSGSVIDAGTGPGTAWLEVDDEYDELDGGPYPVTLGAGGNFSEEVGLTASRLATDADGRTYEITLHALDVAGNQADSDPVTVTVPLGDLGPPQVSLNPPSPDRLWPTNARMWSVSISGKAADPDTGVASAWLEVRDEYHQLDGTYPVTLGPGGDFYRSLNLRAFRLDVDRDGRVYEIILHAVDGIGNEGTTSVTVIVPHDQRKK